MSHASETTPKHKWQRAIKIARGKPEDDEALPGAHHQHAESASKRRMALSLEDTDKQISSFFERQ